MLYKYLQIKLLKINIFYIVFLLFCILIIPLPHQAPLPLLIAIYTVIGMIFGINKKYHIKIIAKI